MNIFIRTSIAQYRVDTYNVLFEKYNFKMCFFNDEDVEQHYSESVVNDRLKFSPYYAKGHKFCNKIGFFCGLLTMMKKESPSIIIVPEFKICVLQAIFYSFF